MKELWGALNRPNLLRLQKTWSEGEHEKFAEQLVSSLPSATVWTDPSRRLAYAYDATGERHWPDAVVFIEHGQDLADVLAVSREFAVPVIGRGAGTSLSGGTTPVLGGIVLAFAHMNHMLHLDPDSREAVVEPGLVNADFQSVLAEQGYFYAPDPSSHRISTLGGNASENSGGPHCVKYGVTTNHVLGGRVYLVDGICRSLPTVRDWRPGLDLTGLIVGSEGTLALLDQLELQITPNPPATATLLVAFDHVATAADAVSAIIAGRIIPSTLELLDKKSIETIERFVHAGYPPEAGAVLLIEVDGSKEDVEAERNTIEAILKEHAALSIEQAKTPAEVANLWKGRRSAYGAAAQIAGHLWIQDVTVPRPLLAEMMEQVTVIGAAHGFSILTIAHAGDGNLHPNLPYNPSDEDEVRRMRSADQAILRACVERGGSITGEHGIGIDKLEQLALMFGPHELKLMADIKRVFDPLSLLNPGKAVLPPDYPIDRGAYPEPPRLAPDSRMDALRSLIVSDAYSQVAVKGSGSQGGRGPWGPQAAVVATEHLDQVVDLDQPNLTVVVEAGVRASNLRDLLSRHHLALPTLPGNTRSLGGLVATNARYWGDNGLGWRDHILALDWLDGLGREFRFGRKTMKNVAGYDVVKLLIGSWGTLGAITRITFRVRPKAPASAVAGIFDPDPVLLAELALKLRNQQVPPRGLLLHWPGPNQTAVLWIWLDGRQIDTQRQMINHHVRTLDRTITWYGSEQVDAVDGDHDAFWRSEAGENCQWLEGGVRPGLLPKQVHHLRQAAHPFFVYPYSGAIEVKTSDPLVSLPAWVARYHQSSQPSQMRPSPEWTALEQGIFELFDPNHRFPAWEALTDE